MPSSGVSEDSYSILTYKQTNLFLKNTTTFNASNVLVISSFFFYFFWFFETGFLCVALAVLELRNPPASASQVLGLKGFTTTARLPSVLLKADRGCISAVWKVMPWLSQGWQSKKFISCISLQHSS
jgi:hypothetical protein